MIRKTLTPERARAILEAYGAEPARWPADERRAMRRALKGDADLQAVSYTHLTLPTILRV